jgi:ATP-dependent Clp protease adaptor protein ClpS
VDVLRVFDRIELCKLTFTLHIFQKKSYITAMAKTPTRHSDDSDTGVITKTKPQTQKPSLYKVLLLNDDFTTQEFVVYVLELVFNKSGEEAVKIMRHVHQTGIGVCGVYTFEVAETKVMHVMDLAKENGHPLQCRMERE